MGAAAGTALLLGAGLVPYAAAPSVATPRTVDATSSVAAVVAKRSLPAVRPGMTSKNVKKLQRLLKVKPRSGWYGPRTRAAVRKFKRSHGLGPGTVFGRKAWRTLLAEHHAKHHKAKKHRHHASPSGKRTGLVCPAPKAHFGNDYGAARTGHLHAGIDMLGKRGMPLYAIENGYVVRAGRQSNGALRIVIQGTRTGAKYYYGHNSNHLLKAGQHFQAGDVIALMGDTGSPGINHLHFEWWKSGGESAHVNPYSLLKRIC
jgi:murein DD-endopeptidase MepM/ murein hydrolase activator NlpD